MRTSYLFGFGAAVAIAAVALALAVYGLDPDGWLYATRWTARVSVLLFAIVFAASGINRLVGPVARPLVANRRGLGLGFAAAHFVHLGALSTYFATSSEHPVPVVLVGGGIGYALILAMALTSTDAAQHRLGRWWKRLHLSGIWYVWLIFFQSYLGRVLGGPERMAQGVYGLTIVSLALVLRLSPRLVCRPVAG